MTKRVLNINVDGRMARGRPKKRWMDCVKNVIHVRGVAAELTNDRGEWKKKTYFADPTHHSLTLIPLEWDDWWSDDDFSGNIHFPRVEV